jgi:hypothetical protein
MQAAGHFGGLASATKQDRKTLTIRSLCLATFLETSLLALMVSKDTKRSSDHL